MPKTKKLNCHISVVGKRNSGVSTLIWRYVHHKYNDKIDIGTGAILPRDETLHGKNISAGISIQKPDEKLKLNNIDIVIVTIDTCDSHSLNYLHNYLKQIKEINGDILIGIAATKLDSPSSFLSLDDIKATANTCNLQASNFIIKSLSAKTGESVDALFQELITAYLLKNNYISTLDLQKYKTSDFLQVVSSICNDQNFWKSRTRNPFLEKPEGIKSIANICSNADINALPENKSRQAIQCAKEKYSEHHQCLHFLFRGRSTATNHFYQTLSTVDIDQIETIDAATNQLKMEYLKTK